MLETENVPILGGLVNHLIIGGVSFFHCEVYFVNKTEHMVKWGTDTKIEYIEPRYKFPIKLGASGEMCISVADSRAFLTKVVGTEHGITEQGLMGKLRAFLMTYLKTYLASVMREQDISIFSVDEHLAEMSGALLQRLGGHFGEYGLVLERFFVTTIVKPEDDRNYQRFRELHFRQYADIAEAQLRQQVVLIEQQTSAQRLVIEAQGISQKRQIEGYSYQDERGFDVAERVAQNPGAGSLAGLGMGLGLVGTAAGMGAAVAGLAVGAVPVAGGDDGKAQGQNEDGLAAFRLRVGKLKLMRESGILSDEEFEAEKKKLLDTYME